MLQMTASLHVYQGVLHNYYPKFIVRKSGIKTSTSQLFKAIFNLLSNSRMQLLFHIAYCVLIPRRPGMAELCYDIETAIVKSIRSAPSFVATSPRAFFASGRGKPLTRSVNDVKPNNRHVIILNAFTVLQRKYKPQTNRQS